MLKLDQYANVVIDPAEIERHVRHAHTLRSEAASNMVKSTLQAGSKMIRDFMSAEDRTSKA
jgi:hypothetical protein